MSSNFYKFTLLICLLLLNTACFRFLKHNTGQIKQSHSGLVTHHYVKTGETLYSIAFEYGRDPREIARWNQIPRPYTIYPNQKLRVIPISTDAKKLKGNKRSNGKKQSGYSNLTSRHKTYVKNTPRTYTNSKLIWRWPTRGKVVTTFSIRYPGRRGIDIVGRQGQPIKSAAAGKVVYQGASLRGYGNLIIVKHNDTYISAYAHTENVVVKEGEKVKLGQILADMGNTSSNKTKLHFEIRRNGKPVNPLKYLPKKR